MLSLWVWPKFLKNSVLSGGSTLIRLRQLSKTYQSNPIPAVSDVSLEIAAGELLVLLGESGQRDKLVNRLNRLSTASTAGL